MPKFDGLGSPRTGAKAPMCQPVHGYVTTRTPTNLLEVHRLVARCLAPDKQTIAFAKAEPKIWVALDQPHGFVSRVDLHDPEPADVLLAGRRTQTPSDHDLSRFAAK